MLTLGPLVRHVATAMHTLMNERARRYRYFASTEHIHEVISSETGKQYIVNLENWTCSCLDWQLKGFPCGHALSVLLGRKLNINHFVQPFYTMGAYRGTYAGTILHPDFATSDAPLDYALNPRLLQLEPPEPLNMEDFIAMEAGDDANEETDERMQPPSTMRAPGRPKKRRIRHDIEREIIRIQHCGRCGKAGHSRRTCGESI